MGNVKGFKLIMADTNLMYTNINTAHAIEVLKKWFHLHKDDIPKDISLDLVIKGIKRLMKYNVFSFGSRYFLQLNGTAMETNVTCLYATIYKSYFEETILVKKPYIKFYRRLIDDAFIVFNLNNATYADPFEELKTMMDSFGPAKKNLTWDVKTPSDTVNFLDLTITINR